jgi:glycosyltransferase involved in cell wall biosynthesis
MGIRNPQISVGLPVFNGERYLRPAVESLLSQSFENFELIISDNASTDGTEQICRDLAKKDKRIIYHRSKENVGVAENFNYVFRLARCELFRWACADDICGKELLQSCYEAINESDDIVLCYPTPSLIDENGQFLGVYEENLNLPFRNPSQRFMHLMQNIGLCNAQYGLIRSVFLKKTCLMENYLGCDIVLLAELCLQGRFVEVKRNELFFRRLHDPHLIAMTSDDLLEKYYNPSGGERYFWRQWTRLIKLFSCTRRGPIPKSEKVRIWAFLLRGMIANRRSLIREIEYFCKFLMKRP